MAREGQGYQCLRHDMMMMMMINSIFYNTRKITRSLENRLLQNLLGYIYMYIYIYIRIPLNRTYTTSSTKDFLSVTSC